MNQIKAKKIGKRGRNIHNLNYNKVYKYSSIRYISNLQIVSMSPSDPKGLLDVFSLNIFLGIF